jgi:hypothetical protein
MTLQKRVEQLLKHTTPIKLATTLGISIATVYRWKSGKAKRAYPLLLEKLDVVEKKILST